MKIMPGGHRTKAERVRASVREVAICRRDLLDQSETISHKPSEVPGARNICSLTKKANLESSRSHAKLLGFSQRRDSRASQARLFFVKALPHEQAGTAAGGADPPRLDRGVAPGSHAIVVRARKVRFRGAELFNL